MRHHCLIDMDFAVMTNEESRGFKRYFSCSFSHKKDPTPGRKILFNRTAKK